MNFEVMVIVTEIIICIEEQDFRRAFISGTAAIDATGRSLYPHDVGAQICKTLEIVEALTSERD